MKTGMLCLLISSLALPVFAATLRVERDGSGDYLVIQDAVDAAASGDTILIGPGRYNEGEVVSTAGWTEFVRVLVHQEELTLIGSDPAETILGPTEPYDSSQGIHKGIVAGPYFGSNKIRVEGIGFENMGHGFKGSIAPDTVVFFNCRFFSNKYTLECRNGNSLEISHCSFNYQTESYELLIAQNQENVVVTDCEFTLEENHSTPQQAVHLERNSNVEIRDCTFNEGSFGLGLITRSSESWLQVEGCRFIGQSRFGLMVSYLNCVVDNCFFDQQSEAFFVYGANLRVRNTAIMEASRWSFGIASAESLNVSNCILAHGEEYTVRQIMDCDKESSKDNLVLQMMNNDWGTTNADTIASWIKLCHFEVDYIPYIGQPVATETKSLGSFKSLFKNR